MDKIRINKYLASLGIASRRKIDLLVDQKRIQINGKIAKNGDKIDPQIDQILLDQKPVKPIAVDLVYIALHKPLNVLSSVSDNRGRTTVIDLVNIPQRVYPVGRLDYQTTGLILLTNDGNLAYQLTHPKYHFPKTYLLTLAQAPSRTQLDLLATGVPLEDGITAKADVKPISSTAQQSILQITLYQGKNRQIRRMCQALGLDLLKLKRITIGPINLDSLKIGDWRHLTPSEIKQLKQELV